MLCLRLFECWACVGAFCLRLSLGTPPATPPLRQIQLRSPSAPRPHSQTPLGAHDGPEAHGDQALGAADVPPLTFSVPNAAFPFMAGAHAAVPFQELCQCRLSLSHSQPLRLQLRKLALLGALALLAQPLESEPTLRGRNR